MKSSNLVILRGNLGGEPEVKALPNGDRVAKLNLATTAFFRGPQGDKVSRTDWHRVEAWGQNAEYAQSYLHKGDHVLVMGAIKHDVVTTPTGTKTTYTTIRAQELQGFGKRAAPAPGAEVPEAVPRGRLPPAMDEDLPF